MSEYKSGYVAATKKTGDRWVMRFDRKNPEDKPKSFYVKLPPGQEPPSEGAYWKEKEERLKRLPDAKGFDWYEVVEDPKAPTNRPDPEPSELQAQATITPFEQAKEGAFSTHDWSMEMCVLLEALARIECAITKGNVEDAVIGVVKGASRRYRASHEGKGVDDV